MLPILGQLFTAILLLLFWRKPVAQRVISVGGSIVVLLLSIGLFVQVWREGIQTINTASWPAPFGIVFVADVFSSMMVLLTGFAGLAVSMFSAAGIARARIMYGYFPILHFLLLGLNGAFLTGDIFNLYVFFEVIIISSFVLMTLGGRRAQIEGAVKYMAMNILASMLFLTGIAILYGLTGTLNLADLSLKVAATENRNLLDIAAVFLIVGFGIKSAVFPLYFWLPSSYHTPPSAVAAVFGGLLTKVGIYALFRIFTLVFVPDDFIKIVFIGIGVMTILTGCFGLLIKRNIRRLFSYMIVCHIGFMVGSLGVFTEVVLVGALFYLFHDVIVKTNLFLVAGLIRDLRGTMNMDKLGGLYADYPKLSLLMAVVLFSLAGIPPLSGFWAKVYLIEGSLIENNYIYIAAVLIGSFVTLYVIAKLWTDVFWKSPPTPEAIEDTFKDSPRARKNLLVIPVVMLACVSLYIGFGAENIIRVTQHIAAEMMDTSPYLEAVLGRSN